MIPNYHRDVGFSHSNHGQHGRRGTIDKKSDRSVYIYYHDGFTATAWSNEAASITVNRGYNQSTERRGRIKIDGCSRKRASSGSQLSSEEPKRGRIKRATYPSGRSRVFIDDRGRSSEMTKQRRSRNSSSIQRSHLTHASCYHSAELYLSNLHYHWGIC